MCNLIRVILAALCLILLPQAHAKPVKPVKLQQAQKERLVLMPLRVGDENQNMQGAMETALVQGLQLKYEVFAGEDVAQKSREIFKKESRTAKKECDETRCMEDIAIAFQSELIATASVTQVEGGYLLALSIRNVMDNKAVYSNSLPCERCSAFQVVEMLKELSGTPENLLFPPNTSSASESKEPETALWNEIKNSKVIDDYQTYLAQYPSGRYATLCRMRIQTLQDEAGGDAANQERQVWQAAELAGDEVSYQNYLRDYPRGSYVGLAQVRLRKLQTNAQVADDEQALWQSAQDRRTVKATQAYLDKYPNGKYAEAAKSRIKKLRDEEAAAKQAAQTDASTSAADRLQAAEETDREHEHESAHIKVLPQYLEKIIPALIKH